jgi:multiple sugar transport system permease protein
LALIIGGLTMLYPFALMMATGAKGPTDQNDNRLVPAFWTDSYELFRKFVDDKYSGRIEAAAQAYGLEAATRLMSSSRPDTHEKLETLSPDRLQKYEQMLMALPLDQWHAGFQLGPGRIGSRLSSKYHEFLREKYGSVDAVNRAYSEQSLVLQAVIPPIERLNSPRWKPVRDKKWADWLAFKATLPAAYRIPITIRGLWIQYLRDKYNNQFKLVENSLLQERQGFDEVEFADAPADYSEFRAVGMPPWLAVASPDSAWRVLTGEEKLPIAAYDYTKCLKDQGQLRREYSTRNFAFIADYVALHGKAVWNTLIFCLLAVLTHLVVNPLAAYALSRFKLPAAGKILLFLLATMAFPAEVTMIPGFLLLRDLGLLNTFAALVLPTAASGYSIYLLKGFFDSLPRDLYESADMEGARETTKLFRITLPLSKPVLAVIALTSFMAAYSSFMFAFLVAQDERMWTLMVWIYQLTNRAPKSVLMAALTLAAIPTLLVFLAAQRVILRGIILPGEK